MKLAYVVHDYGRGYGHGRYVVELAERFSRNHEVHVFANTFGEAPCKNIFFHPVSAWRRTALTSILTFLVPCSMKLRGDFDIIHAQGLCCFRYDVLTAHMCNRAWFRELGRLAGRLDLKQRLFNAIITPLEALLYRHSHRSEVIAVSQLVSRNLREDYGCPVQAHVIYHGIDYERFHPRNRRLWRAEIRGMLGLREDDFIVLYVGDLRKGAATAIKAVAETEATRLVCVSRTDVEPYRRLVKSLALSGRVTLCAPSGEIERFYAAADAFILPTPHDAFGMVVAEAMATGLPVVTNRQTGVAELIEHGKSGFLLDDVSDAHAISQHLARLRDDGDLRRRVGAAARASIEQFSWDDVAQRTMSVYERALSKKNQTAD